MRVICTTQHTPEWYTARLGKCTASDTKRFTARLKVNTKNGAKGEWAKDHHNYVEELAWEMINGAPADHYVSKPMEIGTQFEGEARIEYWMRYGTEVDETGFVLHPKLDWLGCSPDGLVGKDGGLELKVPLAKTHERYCTADEIPDEYKLQMYTNMLCCEREWWDFVSYCPPDIHPSKPDRFRMFRKRLYADKEVFALIEEAATHTIEEAIALIPILNERFPEGQPQRSKVHVELKQSLAAYDHSKDFRDQDHSYLYEGAAALSDTP